MRPRTIAVAWVFVLLLLLSSSLSALDWPDQVEVGQLLILDAPPDVACTWEVSGQDVDGDPYDPVWREFPEEGAVVVETRYGGSLTVSLKTDAKHGLVDVRWCIAVGDDSGGVPGGETDSLVRFVMEQTAKVESDPIERAEIAEIFKQLTKQIEAGKLRGSDAVMKATKASIFADDTLRSNWQSWYAVVAIHLLDELRLVTQSQWAVAYAKVAKGVVQ
jgi:hypothetical protein